MLEEAPKSPASVASPETRDSEPPEDIVQSQRRQIEELERKLEASRQQLEAVRREAAGAAASDQSRRLLQAHLCVTQLRAQLDALKPPPRYLLADAPPDRLVRLFTVTPPAATPETTVDSQHKTNPAYILNGVKVVPIAILPTHYEPERTAPPPPPPPPPMPQTPLLHDSEDSRIMDDVLEILVENGELPPSAVEDVAVDRPIDPGYLTTGSNDFSPADVLNDDVLGDTHVRDSLAADELQRELNDIQNEIMNHADMHAVSKPSQCDIDPTAAVIDPDLSVDLLANNDFHSSFTTDQTSDNNDDFFGRLLSGECDEKPQMAMDIVDDAPERMSMTPLTNGDILDHNRTGFEDMDDLSLPSFQNEDSRHGAYDDRPCEFDLKDFESLGTHMNMDSDGYDMDTELIPNLFGRGHVPQCDPLLGGVLARPPPRPATKHYSWERIEFDAT
ncbi:unnamed protein product [Parnassius apollo]|uniref:(apollo) hypothetical protein n=1 Tax=Parnassius apollo TaxID=110799 RepID=A0A8S3W8V4_PARAO|nr:unnamed protein product [Parnassius apollo]